MKQLVLVLAFLVAGVAAAGECENDCSAFEKKCVVKCKEGMKKSNPKMAKYCAPKCEEISKQCKKDCDDEAHGRPLDQLGPDDDDDDHH